MIGREPIGTLGIDAGATRCRARLRDPAGNLLAESEGPAANAYVNFERAVAVARGVAEAALSRAGIAPEQTSRIQLGLGVAGVGSLAEAERFAAGLPGFAVVRVVNDAVAACIGAHGGADGGLVILGTGSAGIARVAGAETIVGGRGFHLGDDGSAARLGYEAARAAMRAVDGLGPSSELTHEIIARFETPLAFVHWAAQATPRDYGEFAPLALAAASRGDGLARGLVDAAAAAAAALIRRVEALGAPRVSMVGGLGAALIPFLEPQVAARIEAPLYDPTDGAIALVGGVLPDAEA